MLKECEALFAAILRPGLVYHDTERPWSVPLGLAANLTHRVTGSGPPGTNLRVLVDHTIREALRDHQTDDRTSQRHVIISALDMKTSFPL